MMGKVQSKKIWAVNFSNALFSLLSTHDELAMQTLVWLCLVWFRAICFGLVQFGVVQFSVVQFGALYVNLR
jgi:hypothetical protein